MIGWLLDTNVLSSISRTDGAPSVAGWAASQDEQTFFISILSIAEYDKGIHNLPDGNPDRYRFETSRDRLLERFAERLLSVDDDVVRLWGAISGRVKRKTGHPPGVIDTLLAATAIRHDLYLVTRNVRDVQFSGAAVFNPWTDDPARFPLSPFQA